MRTSVVIPSEMRKQKSSVIGIKIGKIPVDEPEGSQVRCRSTFQNPDKICWWLRSGAVDMLYLCNWRFIYPATNS